MTEAAQPKSAGSLAPSTPVVSASIHTAIVARLEGDISFLEAEAEKAWHAHQVFFIAGVAFIAGTLVHFI